MLLDQRVVVAPIDGGVVAVVVPVVAVVAAVAPVAVLPFVVVPVVAEKTRAVAVVAVAEGFAKGVLADTPLAAERFAEVAATFECLEQRLVVAWVVVPVVA